MDRFYHIVLAWILGNPHRFKVYIGNRVTQILDLTPADSWKHVTSEENPADCASRGFFPSELLTHDLWWKGPPWLSLPPSDWPKRNLAADDAQEESDESSVATCNLVTMEELLIPVDKFSSFTHYKRITAWIIRFIYNCRARSRGYVPKDGCLTTSELTQAANYWYSVIHLNNE